MGVTSVMKAQDKGGRFGCDQCDYKACQQGDLIKHKNGKHEGVRGLVCKVWM
jgi:hypothetical protein